LFAVAKVQEVQKVSEVSKVGAKFFEHLNLLNF